MQALAKMTIMPARRLESIAPQMKNKGRLRVGADADITVFDPERVRDTATFEKGLSFSAGIDHVVVNGVPVVRDGKTVPNTFPGKAVLRQLRFCPVIGPLRFRGAPKGSDQLSNSPGSNSSM